MELLAISAFALALGALGLAAAAFYTSSTSARAQASLRATSSAKLQQDGARLTKLGDHVLSKLRDLERQSPAKLAAEVAALAEAVESLRDTHRRFAGKVWQKIGDRKEPSSSSSNGADDDELARVLALQTAPAPPPGG